MATKETYINQVPKSEYSALRIEYTSKDYVNILDDLINSIPGITQKWNTTDTNDVGMILVKMMAIVGDMLFYNLDMQVLEVYPNSVTQRKNAATIYKLIGYKMKWYRSATLEADFVNTYTYAATIPRFCSFTTDTGGITYTNFNQLEVPSNTQNNGLEKALELVEGTPVTPTRGTGSPYPEPGKAWHSIYNFNYTSNDVVNNRIYLKDINVDQDHIILVDDQNEEWELKENIYLTTDVGKFFQFDIDVNDNPYLELVDYWNNFSVNKFKVFYIKSSGEAGQVYANTLTRVTGSVWAKVPSLNGDTVYNINSFIKFTHFDSTLGYDPETPDEARKNSALYQNTLDTIITLADFERATLRQPGVANVRATDLTNDPGIQTKYFVGDVNQDGTIDQNDYDMIENYLTNSAAFPLNEFQYKLADINQDGVVDENDLTYIGNFLNPIMYNIGDIDQDGQITNADLTRLQQLVEELNTLDAFRLKLSDINHDGIINENDLKDLNSFINTTMWDIGDLNLDGVIDKDDLTLLKAMVERLQGIDEFVLKLADINQDGEINDTDVRLLSEYVNSSQKVESPFGQLQDEREVAQCGKKQLTTTELLQGFAVRLYILPTEEYDNEYGGIDETTDDNLTTQIQTSLRQYKILPLDIDIRLHDINRYYWTVMGTFYTKVPLNRDELQQIMININNTMRHIYSRDRMNFNTVINYKDVIETILSVDDRILMVDLEPIKYFDNENNEVPKDVVTGKFESTIPLLSNEKASDNLKYEFFLPNTPVLQGSLMIRVNDGQYILTDNSNGEINNTDNILSKRGKIDYVTGKVILEYNAPLIQPMIINYTQNKTNIALYKNLSTQTFYFDSSSLESDDSNVLV